MVCCSQSSTMPWGLGHRVCRLQTGVRAGLPRRKHRGLRIWLRRGLWRRLLVRLTLERWCTGKVGGAKRAVGGGGRRQLTPRPSAKHGEKKREQEQQLRPGPPRLPPLVHPRGLPAGAGCRGAAAPVLCLPVRRVGWSRAVGAALVPCRRRSAALFFPARGLVGHFTFRGSWYRRRVAPCWRLAE